ncbi:9613_t:CDS:1, partial [Acaulospora colombiana]
FERLNSMDHTLPEFSAIIDNDHDQNRSISNEYCNDGSTESYRNSADDDLYYGSRNDTLGSNVSEDSYFPSHEMSVVANNSLYNRMILNFNVPLQLPFDIQCGNFYFDDEKLIESFQAHPTTSSDLLLLDGEGCQDIIIITRAFANQTLRFNLSHIVTCKKLTARIVPPKQLRRFISEIFSSLKVFNPTENVNATILKESTIGFDLPEGLTFRFKEFKEHKILFELFNNQVSDQLLKQVQEDVILKTRKGFLEFHLEEKVVNEELMDMANKFFGSGGHVIKMISDMLVYDHVKEFEENTGRLLNSFLRSSNIYLQVEDSSFAYKMISRYHGDLSMGKSLIVKTSYNERRDLIWMLDLIDVPCN